MSALKSLLVATRNKGKAREIAQILEGRGVSLVSLNDYPDIPDVDEDGDTFLANARKKARHFHEATGLPTLADDSGLAVDALDGAPGVHSARFAGEPKDDRRNNLKLLAELEKIGAREPSRRTARFVCCMVFWDGAHELAAHGEVEGSIGFEPKGGNGFGYDPLFVVREFGKTAAELPAEVKNRVSHRGRALAAMLEMLESAAMLADAQAE